MELDKLKKSEIIAELEKYSVPFNKADKKEDLLNILIETLGSEKEIEKKEVEKKEVDNTFSEKSTKIKASYIGKSGREFPLGVFDSEIAARRAYARKGGKELILVKQK